MNINNILDYSYENNTCTYVWNLEEIIDTIGINSVEDKVKKTIFLESVTHKETLITSRPFHNLMVNSKSHHQNFWI